MLKNVIMAALFLISGILSPVSRAERYYREGFDEMSTAGWYDDTTKRDKYLKPIKKRLKEIAVSVKELSELGNRNNADNERRKVQLADLYWERERLVEPNTDLLEEYQEQLVRQRQLKVSLDRTQALKQLLDLAFESSLDEEIRTFIDAYLNHEEAERLLALHEMSAVAAQEKDPQRKKTLESVVKAMLLQREDNDGAGKVVNDGFAQLRLIAGTQTAAIQAVRDLVDQALAEDKRELVQLQQWFEQTKAENAATVNFERIDAIATVIFEHKLAITSNNEYNAALEKSIATFNKETQGLQAKAKKAPKPERKWRS